MPERLDDILDELAHPLPGIELGLERVLALLEKMGNPHHRLPPVVHVAGTNGKASTLAFLRAMCEAAGLTVHVYSSPELVRFNERIVLAGEMVEDAPLLNALQEVQRLSGEHPVTFFEATTAAAFSLFAEHKADILLLETGLGGRLDATNVVEHPALTLLTPISMDHQDYLGDTLAAIATEKAGILKAGCSCVVAGQMPEALKVIQERARVCGAPLFVQGEDWCIEAAGQGLRFSTDSDAFDVPMPQLVGEHQAGNAGCAIMAARLLKEQGFAIDDDALARGIAEAQLPGRLQHLTKGTLVDAVPEGWELWVDGGHNAAAGEVLAAWMQTRHDKPIRLICGMMKDKDMHAFLRPMTAHVELCITLPLDAHGRGSDAETLWQAAQHVGMKARVAHSFQDAFQEALAGSEPAIIVSAGSLTLAGQLLSENGTPPA